MKITYYFADGTRTEVEVTEDIGLEITNSRRQEENLARKERYHCLSLDTFDFEGDQFADPSSPEDILETSITNQKLRDALNSLTDTQRRRFLMYANGLSYREIARLEGVSNHSKISKSVEGAIKNLKIFLD